jgi:hypothetical protein
MVTGNPEDPEHDVFSPRFPGFVAEPLFASSRTELQLVDKAFAAGSVQARGQDSGDIIQSMHIHSTPSDR